MAGSPAKDGLGKALPILSCTFGGSSRFKFSLFGTYSIATSSKHDLTFPGQPLSFNRSRIVVLTPACPPRSERALPRPRNAIPIPRPPLKNMYCCIFPQFHAYQPFLGLPISQSTHDRKNKEEETAKTCAAGAERLSRRGSLLGTKLRLGPAGAGRRLLLPPCPPPSLPPPPLPPPPLPPPPPQENWLPPDLS